VLGGESHREELGYLQIVIRLGSPAWWSLDSNCGLGTFDLPYPNEGNS
jgi:hypothetical protein